MSEECQELKNIKYQTMLLNNNSKIVSTKANTDNLDDFLQKEKDKNKNKPWSKLGRSMKLRKLTHFVTHFAIENKLSNPDKKRLHVYLNDSLDRKKLQRVKDVNYEINKKESSYKLDTKDKRKIKVSYKNI